MEGITPIAAKEVITVLFSTNIELLNKIPNKLISALELKAEQSQEKVDFMENLTLSEQTISDEAKAMLMLIYKDFLCNEEEKESFDKQIINMKGNINGYN